LAPFFHAASAGSVKVKRAIILFPPQAFLFPLLHALSYPVKSLDMIVVVGGSCTDFLVNLSILIFPFLPPPLSES